jgi:hypothetical protein
MPNTFDAGTEAATAYLSSEATDKAKGPKEQRERRLESECRP